MYYGDDGFEEGVKRMDEEDAMLDAIDSRAAIFDKDLRDHDHFHSMGEDVDEKGWIDEILDSDTVNELIVKVARNPGDNHSAHLLSLVLENRREEWLKECAKADIEYEIKMTEEDF